MSDLDNARRDDARIHAKTGDRVEVRYHRSPGQPETWTPAKIRERVARGCFVLTDSGHTNFFAWCDIRRIVTEVKVEPKPLAKLGDVLRLPTASPHRSPAPEAAAETPKPAATPVVSPPLLPSSRRRSRRLHISTAIGGAFRAWRLRMGYSQGKAAELIATPANRLSRIELGDTLPDDGELLRLAELASLDVGELERLRDGAPEPAPEENSTGSTAPRIGSDATDRSGKAAEAGGVREIPGAGTSGAAKPEGPPGGGTEIRPPDTFIQSTLAVVILALERGRIAEALTNARRAYDALCGNE